ncbi:inner membrane peptidase Atp23 [Schizosaccharomyces octosporus yFS286]|uniref:Mitochondrial inner membrane protease ATP23 n=1 Tax=Schizosaccharomyces octosporus (strain yFS286) TaxID=483514 RepID=S9PW99_SCHOY|nr:inner membrane peptidase Atp23 [Schizosaccharomyces octosporus yFS286]EPX71758.1 inner membrane peptidase Atp23 [Schizosaccharomyces octosporus yFS286]
MSETTKIEPSREKRNCERVKKALLSDSPILVFLKKSLGYLNSDFDASDIRCEPCDEKTSGGFVPGKGIVLCENRIYSQKMAENTIAHEMIHWFDDCRFHVNWEDLRHHACSEIRASSLSGECRWTKELFYGNIHTFRKHHQECVKRRATLSVQGNPKCQSKNQAEMIVQEVFASCFRDTRPFEKIY